MKIGLHDADRTRFPNLALMKLSAHHRDAGDEVSWFKPIQPFDIVYSSRVFTYTAPDPYLPPDAIIGGAAGDPSSMLPDEIEHTRPDFGLYGTDYGIGYTTRGCPRRCPWCVVPKIEGDIRAHAEIGEFTHPTSTDLVLLDNNALAHEHGIAQLEAAVNAGLRVDYRQGLDARIIARDEALIDLLARAQWMDRIRLACDTRSQIESVERTVAGIRSRRPRGIRFSCYVLVLDVADALERVTFLLGLNVDPFAQPFRGQDGAMDDEARAFARWVNRRIYRKTAWSDYSRTWRRSQETASEVLFR